MNYRHLYHAGNFADVIKHVFLIELIHSLLKKPAPFCYIDTHAGAGHYDLFSEFAAKNKEYKQGIEKIIQQEKWPLSIKQYINCVNQINNKLSESTFASLRYYPGSPMIARHFMRTQDRMVVCELQPQEHLLLKAQFANDKQTAVHHMDGFLALKAYLPPREHRGLILIDPPYENPDEYTRIASTLPDALKRFENGIYVIWYPIKEKTLVERFHRTIRQQIKQPIFIIELSIYPYLPNHLAGCGLCVINPPWQFDQSVQKILPSLWKALTINKQGEYRSFLLK